MLRVSIYVELLRAQPRLLFWLATLAQAAIWWLVPVFFYSSPPGDLAQVIAIGHEFQLGSDRGPPLAFWLAEIVYSLAGIGAVYLLAQICVVITYWAVFALARAIVGIHQAVIAVLLMVGISATSFTTPAFGPPVLAMALAALVVLHFWRALGEDKRHYWFILGLELGLLGLSSHAGLILLALMTVFIAATQRGRAVLLQIEPWLAAVVVVLVWFPHLIWLDATGALVWPTLQTLRSAARVESYPLTWGSPFVRVLTAHLGLAVLAMLAAPWRAAAREKAPVFAGREVDSFSRRFIYFFALAPVFVASGIAGAMGEPVPAGGIAPYVTLSGLAVVIAAGPAIALRRQRFVAFAWTLLLLMPPAVGIAAHVGLPWIAGIELRTAKPAAAIAAFFADNFERRTGKPLAIVSGDPHLAALIAIGASSRPSFYDYARPARTPWVKEQDIRRKGLVVVWSAAARENEPPADIKQRFPDLVAEVPRTFARPTQGRLPLMRIGWGMIRPQE